MDDIKQSAEKGTRQTKPPGGSGASTTQSATDRARDAFAENVIDPAKRVGEAIKQTGHKVAEGGGAVGMKMIDQAEQNAREAFAAMREAANAKDLGQVMKIQAEFLREQGKRSVDQARAIGELIVQVGKDAVAPLTGKD